MLKTRIIPCLDVKDGRVVKGINFVDLVDAGNPVEVAKTYDKNGADELCFLDITASHEKRPILLDTVKKTAEQCFMPLTVGGGVRSISDIQSLLSSGADKVSINTAAVSNPDLIYEASSIFGSQCIVVAIDAKIVSKNKWEIFTHGGRNSTGLDVLDYAKEVVLSDFEEPGDDDVVRKVLSDFDERGLTLNEADLRKEMDRLIDEAARQIEIETC